MNLFIRLKDGVPVEHPDIESNLRTAYPSLNWDSVPEGWAKFVRIPRPNVDGFFVVENGGYARVGDVVQDVWNIRSMTAQERENVTQSAHEKVASIIAWTRARALERLKTATPEAAVELNKLLERLDNFTYDDPFKAVVPALKKITS